MTAHSIRSGGPTLASGLPIYVKAQRAEYAFMICDTYKMTSCLYLDISMNFWKGWENTMPKTQWRLQTSLQMSAT
jgi:hypothetical protein